jgi:hypothetical protein
MTQIIAGIQVIGKSHKLCLEGSSPSPASSFSLIATSKKA